MPSRLLTALVLAAATAAAAEERPAPPPPAVRGPALPAPLASAPAAEPPQAAEPTAAGPRAPEVAAPATPTAPAAAAAHGEKPHEERPPATAAGKPTLEDHAATAIPGLGQDAARSAGSDAAAAAAAVRGLTSSKREPAAGPREQLVPPSLTGRALAEELRRSAGGRASEKEALAAERARLEKLGAEIAESRAALKVETDRLAALVKAAAAAPDKAQKPGARPGSKGVAPPSLDTLAKTVKSMKADQAATLLGRVDRSLAATLLQRMKPAEAAAVLDRMDGAESAALVALIAKKESP